MSDDDGSGTGVLKMFYQSPNLISSSFICFKVFFISRTTNRESNNFLYLVVTCVIEGVLLNEHYLKRT